MKRPRLRSLLPPLILLLLPLILFAPVTLGSRTLLPVDNLFAFEPYRSAADELGVGRPHNALLSDLILQNYPWKRFIVQSIQARQLPLWNPYLFSGVTFLANGHPSALYPLSVIYYVVPLWRAFGVFTVLQLGLAGLLMYVFARVLGISRLGGLIAGMTFQLSGFFLVSVVHPMIIAAAAWLPLLLAAIELIIRQHPLLGRPATVPWVLLGALALGCATLAGHAEILYFALLVSAFYTAWRLVYHYAGLPGTGRVRMGKLGRPAGWILVMVVLGLALGAIQLVPTVEVAGRSFREGRASLSQVRAWAYPARRILTFFAPNVFGNPAHHGYFDLFAGRVVRSPQPIDWGIKNYVEGGAYLGLLPLFLAALAVLAQFTNLPVSRKLGFERLGGRVRGLFRHPHVPLFLVLALLSLAFIFGTPLYALVYALPYISQSHSPFRWVFPLTLSVAVLAGFGVDVLRRTRATKRTQYAIRDTQYVSRITYHVSPVATLRGLVSRIIFLDAPPSLITSLASLAFWGGLLLIAGLFASRLFFDTLEPTITRLFHALAKADAAFPDVRAFYSYEFRWLLLAGLTLTATGIVLRVSRCPIYLPRRLGRRPVWELLAVGVLALDLLAFGHGFFPAADPALLDYVPPVVQFLQQDEGLWRFTTFDPRDLKTFNANAGWFYDLQDVRGYDSLFSAQYRDYMRLIDQQDELDFNRVAPLRHWSALDSPMLDLLNVKYVLTEENLDNSPKYQRVYQDEALRVYQNLGVMPRAYSLDYACTTLSDEPLATMQRVDPRQTVILRPQDLPAPPPAGDAAGCVPLPAAVTRYTPNEVFVDVEAEGPRWLVLADSYAPGWKAFVRPRGGAEVQETELEIARVAGNFRGVTLEAGAWTVRFRYSPDPVKIGAFLSFLGGIVSLFLAGAWLWRFFYREEDEASTVRRVAKNSIAPITIQLLNRAVEMGFAALYARILGPEGTGKYAYAIVIFGWFDILTNFGLNTLLLREVARDKAQANRYFVNSTVLRLILIALAVPLLVGFVLARNALGTAPLERDTVLAIGLFFLGLVPTTISAGLTALFQAYEKHELPAAITSVATMVKVSLGTLVLILGWGIVGLAGVSIVTGLVTLTILLILALRLFPSGRLRLFRPRLAHDWRLQWTMARESLPLMLNHLMATLFFRVDIILIEGLRTRRGVDGSVIVGWYSWAYKGVDVLNIIPSFFTFAIFPVMSRQAHEDRAALSATYHLAIKLLVVLALPAALAMTLLARPFISVLGGSAFLPHSALALQLMVWSIPIGWINSVTNYVLIAVDRQRFLTRAFVAGLAFNLVANLIFVPLYDYRAAAIITIFSELVLLAAFYVGIRRYLAPVPWAALLWRPALAGALMAGVGLALWPLSVALALLAALGVYGVAVFALGVFTPREVALVLGRRRGAAQPGLVES